jgi:hypothetical protein
MQCRAAPPDFVQVIDPLNPWHGRLGTLVHRDEPGTWWRDHLTGTEVLLSQPPPQEMP